MMSRPPTDGNGPGLTARRVRDQLALARLRLLHDSPSWQLAAPLRVLEKTCPRLVRTGLLATKFVYWTCKGQLPARLKAWRRQPDLSGTKAELPDPAPPVRIASPGRKSILIADMCVPELDRGAGFRTTFALISCFLAEGWSVTFWPDDRRYAGAHTRYLEDLGVAVADERLTGGIDAWIAEHGNALDHVLLMRPAMTMALLPPVLRGTRAVISYYGHDLHFVRLRREAALQNDPDLADRAERMLTIERHVWRLVDYVFYPSRDEIDIVEKLEPGVSGYPLTPYSYDTFACRNQPPAERVIFFVGGFLHRPNEDAALWLARTIFPLIRARVPDARLVIAGADPSPAIKGLADAAIEVTGRVSDERLAELYDTARVAMAPLRYGAGVKGKVVEALRYGVPVVTTPVGTEGLSDCDRFIATSSDAEGQAAAAVRLLTDDAAWISCSQQGVAYAKRHFSMEALRESIITIIEHDA